LGVQHTQSRRQARLLAQASTGGRSDAGKATIQRLGCGACHVIEGVSGADGAVGPALKGLAARVEVTGKLPADPTSLIAWIRRPQEISPGVGMPDIAMSEQDARDLAAYLYAIR
jgi:cytochrome c2